MRQAIQITGKTLACQARQGRGAGGSEIIWYKSKRVYIHVDQNNPMIQYRYMYCLR